MTSAPKSPAVVLDDAIHLLQTFECQMGLNGSPKRLKLRKTLHLADTIRCGNRFRENPSLSAKQSALQRNLAGFS